MHKKYVFVACGDAIHIQTLHFSIAMLRRWSTLDIIVVTDTRRNIIPVQHPYIIDMPVDAALSHHQAAIYLKTCLHRILPLDDCIYCYLDTDVVAIRAEVDTIFDYYTVPITFCTDHCKIKAFSPNAIHDVFYDALLQKQEHLSALYHRYAQEEVQQQAQAGLHFAKTQQLKADFNRRRPLHAQPWRGPQAASILLSKGIFWLLYGWAWLSAWLRQQPAQHSQRLERLHRRIFKMPLNFALFLQEQGYYFSEMDQKWFLAAGKFLYEENFIIKKIESTSPFRWDDAAQCWRDELGNNISVIESDKLLQLIRQKFDVDITNPDWRHWNGGVFLFDWRSADFMEQWHQWTMEIFADPKWKTRDQGTLIATTWKMELQQHPVLPMEYNFIADYYHPALHYKGNLCFDIAYVQSNISPWFLHIYHHWGDASWPVWQDVARLHATTPGGSL